MMWRALFSLLWLCLSLSTAGCATREATESATRASPASLAGTWRAVLESPGGELPFELEIEERSGGLSAVVINGGERTELSSVEIDGSEVVLGFDWYDAEIRAELSDDGETLAGRWRKTGSSGDSTLPFSARRGDAPRFAPVAASEACAATIPEVGGVWAAEFRDVEAGDGEPAEPARGELEQRGERVTGTFLTPTGDYRFLEGRYEQGRLRLSTFDGAHAFLFDACAQPDGTLAGDFWSRDSYHATWTARRADEGEALLPDAWQQVGLTNDERRLSFAFPDLDGRTVSLDDPRFDGKVVLVNVFGSWCPNCNDEAPVLARWHQRYRERGLEIVGLAYELTGDPERDARQVRRFAERYGLDYPLLLAGVSDKAKAAETLPDLSAVLAFPTTILLDRAGEVRYIHSGFAGPGTGEHFERLVATMEERIEELLAENATPATAGS